MKSLNIKREWESKSLVACVSSSPCFDTFSQAVDDEEAPEETPCPELIDEAAGSSHRGIGMSFYMYTCTCVYIHIDWCNWKQNKKSKEIDFDFKHKTYFFSPAVSLWNAQKTSPVTVGVELCDCFADRNMNPNLVAVLPSQHESTKHPLRTAPISETCQWRTKSICFQMCIPDLLEAWIEFSESLHHAHDILQYVSACQCCLSCNRLDRNLMDQSIHCQKF